MSRIISRKTLQALMDSDKPYTIIEALPKQFYESEHLPGAINVPHDAVQQVVPDLIPDKSEMVVVYCANSQCQNSHVAVQAMEKLGYSNVFEFSEGKAGWKEAGLPLES